MRVQVLINRFNLILVSAGVALLVVLIGALWPSPGYASVTSKQVDKLMEPCPGHAGQWVSGKIYGMDYWFIYTMNFRQISPGSTKVVGKMFLLGWSGTPQDNVLPRECSAGKDKFHVSLEARGHIKGNQIQIEATRILGGRNFCGSVYHPSSYNLDRFTGTIDYNANTIKASLTDGGRFHNQPATFRKKPC